MLDLADCAGCPLEGLHSRPAELKGSYSAPFLVVSDTPSRSCHSRGTLLQQNAMDILVNGLKQARFNTDDFCMVPQIRCPYLVDEYTTKDNRLIQQTCRAHLIKDIDQVQPEAIITLGAGPARQVLNHAVKVTKIRGTLEHSEEFNSPVFPMLGPTMVSMYPQHNPVFMADCESFGRLVDSNYNAQAAGNALLGKYTIINDLEFLIEQNPEIVFFDTETSSLDFFHTGKDNVRDYDPKTCGKDFDPSAAILTMQFCIKPGEAYMLVWDHPEAPISLRGKARIIPQLRRLLCRPEVDVIGQNTKFDVNFLWATTGIRLKVGGDTLMVAALLDENAISKSQNVLVKQYVPEMAGYDDHFNATVDKSRMWEAPLSAILDYGCGDVDSGLLLYHRLMDKLEEDRALLNYYCRVSLPGINTFVTVENKGLGVDEDALDAFEELMTETVKEQERSLLEQVPKSIRRKHIDKGLKFSRSAFVLDILFYHKDGFRLKPKVFTDTTRKLSADRRVPSTSSKDHLPYFFDECTFTVELAQHMKDSRMLGTNINGFKNKYIHDGLVRPTYSLSKTVTGRSACIKGDTPVCTMRGIIRADEVLVGDYVWTHKNRWRKVTALFTKPFEQMFALKLSNGEVLRATSKHSVLSAAGEWVTVQDILEKVIKTPDAQRPKLTGFIGHANSRGIILPTDVSGLSVHRDNLFTYGGVSVEDWCRAGSHLVYDFQVDEDHSYLACGVFNHNSENPNGQNFPNRGPNAVAYRRIFIPPPGCFVLEADLSQAELRIAADMANDREMLRIYRAGGDIHKATACIALGITMEQFNRLPKAEQKDWRTKAKAINFGFLYGMGWRKFISYAKTQYGVVFTEQEAQRIREAFFDRYAGLPHWHAAMRELAHRYKQVRSYSGRIRHLPMIDSEDAGIQSEAERQAINSPVQEFASSLGVMAMGRLNEEIDPKYLCPVAFVHDAIYCYVPHRYAEWGAKTLKWFMETNPLEEWFNLQMKCPIIADVSLGNNLGDKHELEGFSLDSPYDFSELWDTETETGLYVPAQRIPPNNGRQVSSIYTTAM